ncbi:MAG: motility protein A, partial [Candidatus Sericytochromatia bacterium]
AVLAYPGTILRAPMLLMKAALASPPDVPTAAAELVKASDRVRQSGRAAAVGSNRDTSDPFLRSGLQLVADGLEPREIRDVLESDLQAMRARHRGNINLFEGMGGFSPVFGILGTVEAMIAILGNLTSPEKLGPEIALAMVATLYGVGFANLLFIPVGNRLKKLSEEELRVRQLMIDVIVAIQEGAKPEFIRERLRAGLPPDIRRSIMVKSRSRAKRAAAATVPAAAPVAEEAYDQYAGGEQYGTEEEEYYGS